MIYPFFSFLILLTVPFWPYGTSRQGAEIKKSSYEMPAQDGAFETIRIALMKGVTEARVASDGPYVVKDSKGRPLFRGTRMAPQRVYATADGIGIGAQRFRDSTLTMESPGGSFQLGGKDYRNAIRVIVSPVGKITLINEISIDDYLKGVLPWEANPNWPMESLKAQAIASRTYALFKAIENRSGEYHLTADVMSQVYGGKKLENPRTNQAVDETRGLVMAVNGKIFPGYFHSTCGGRTTQAEYLWDIEPHPSLKGVVCTFCVGSKHYRWSNEYALAGIETRLREKGVKIYGVTDVQPVDKDASGRFRGYLVTHAKGTTKFHENDFRIWMDPMKFKSNLIQHWEKRGKTISVAGRGWGHGVGLCQFGMKHLGEMGYTAKQILKYYFPGSGIVNREDYLRAGAEPVSADSPDPETPGFGSKIKGFISEYI